MIKNLQMRLPEVGKIKIGGLGQERESKAGKKYRQPIRLDHFVITKTTRDEKGLLVHDSEVMGKLDKKPKELRVQLLFDDIDMNFQTCYSWYSGKQCVCRGDGETAKRVLKNGKTIDVECSSECEFLVDNKCKVSGVLSCMLPDAVTVGGVYKFRTHSINSVLNILGALLVIKKGTGGMLSMLPLKLLIQDRQTEKHGTVKVVSIVFDGSETNLKKSVKIEMARRDQYDIDMKQLENEALTSGALIDRDDPAAVEAEFYPEEAETNANKKGSSPEEVSDKLKAIPVESKEVKPEVKQPKSGESKRDLF